jgi:PAS domain S-box-containing protein
MCEGTGIHGINLPIAGRFYLDGVIFNMESPLKILYVEDKLTDFLLVERHLQKHGLAAECERAASRAELVAALQNQEWEVVLSDFNVPALPFDEILALLRPQLDKIPLILISGSVGEERAVELLKQGVWDFVLKDNLARLVPSMRRSLRDVADRQARINAEAALRESEEKFRQMAENTDDVVWMSSLDLKVVHYVSPAYEKVWGRSVDSLYAQPDDWQLAILPEERHLVRAAFSSLVANQTSTSLEYRITRPDGSVRWIHDRGYPVLDDHGQVIRLAGIATDVTERRNAEEERLWLTAAMDQAAESIVITDLAGSIQYVNPAFERITGYSRREAIGQNTRLLKSGQHDDAFFQKMWETVTRGEVWHGHFINRRKNGTLFEEDVTISPVRDPVGKVVNYMAIKLDVTREVELENRYRQSQKLEAIGQLAGGVAHDFNNILTSMLMQIELARMDGGLPEGVGANLKQIYDDASRAASLTRQLLLFSRRQIMQSRDLDLNDVINNLAKMLQRIIGEDVHLQLHLHPTPLLTHADPGMLDQVAMNLAVNARDAMPQGGRLVIGSSELVVNPELAQQQPDAVPGRYVCLSVSDNGSGIPPEILPRIFEPFFTTKEVGRGTGLGLATVFGIVKQHRGWITVDSAPGAGTTFKVFLPALQRGVLEVAETVAKPPGGTETILFAEDDVAVRKSTVTILRQRGYQVLDAASGPEALKLWSQKRDAIALLFTDLVMPGGITGRQLATQLQTEKPGLKVIYASGYSADIAGREIQLQSGENFIQKPVHPDELLKIIRECLDN